MNFADIEARATAAIVRRMVNASLQVGGGGPLIDGVIRREPVMPEIGGAAMQAELVNFVFVTADLGSASLAEGAACSVGSTNYLVALRTDNQDGLHTKLELKAA